MIGLIGGSGLYELPGFKFLEVKEINTPYGYPSEGYTIGMLSDRKVAFLARHSSKHNIPPHLINYRANIWGFKQLGVERIIAINAVGGINEKLRPGMIVIPNQIIDFTKLRKNTFYEGPEVVHIDFTEPFCPQMRNTILNIAKNLGIQFYGSGTYVCTDGPRLETKAEIKMFKTLGFDIVGMTGMPEAVLAKEAEICYLMIAVVTNYAAGLTGQPLTTTEVLQSMQKVMDIIKKTLSIYIPSLPLERNCRCKKALENCKI